MESRLDLSAQAHVIAIGEGGRSHERYPYRREDDHREVDAGAANMDESQQIGAERGWAPTGEKGLSGSGGCRKR